MSGWGFGGTFRALSNRLFGDDLAEELDPSMASLSATSSSTSTRTTTSSSPGVLQHSSVPSSKGDLIHVRSRREHEPRPRPADLSAEQLQESMKELMRHPKLWTMYKEELSTQELPTHPETVRRVLIQFLEDHGHEITSQPTTTHRPASIFQGWNVDLEGESTHVSKTRPHHVFPKNDIDQKGQDKGKSEDLESLMKRLMMHPELWTKYKDLLSQENSPDDPGTIRRLLIEFWKEHEQQVLRLEQKNYVHNPRKGPTASKSDQAPQSFFQAFNTDLNSESQHVQDLHPQNSLNRRRSSASANQRQSQIDTHRQLRLLRSSPALYAKYQERLLMDESEEDTPAADLLSKFLLEHKDELAALDLADQEARLKEAQEASLLNLETATMEDEKTESTIKSTREKRERLQPDRRQKFMAYRDSISSQSMRGLQDAMEALAGETKRESSPDPKQRNHPPASNANTLKVQPSPLSQSEHPQLSRDRRQKFMAYKDTISSRSLRGIQEAMDSLSVEATLTPTGQVDSSTVSNADNAEGRTPAKRTSGRDSLSEDGDLNSSIGSLVAWGHSFSLSNVSKFVTHEMETLTSELQDSEAPTKHDSELIPSKGIFGSRGDNHGYKDNNDDDDDDDGDLMLQQAAEIAVRHRRFHASNGGILESIPDENEEDGLDSQSEGVSADSPTSPAHHEPSSETLTMELYEPPQGPVGDDSQVSLENNDDNSPDDVNDDDSLI